MQNLDIELYKQYNVKRGLRNEDGSGVLVGLTDVGNVVGYEKTQDKIIPTEGKLFYRGYNISEIVEHILEEKRFGFEEVSYLLLYGELPNQQQLSQFHLNVIDKMPLQKNTLLHIIEMEGRNIMNILSRSVLELYTFDQNPDDTSVDNTLRQSIELLAKFPTIISYAYNMLRHGSIGRSLHIRHPQKDLSIAENFLYMLKGNNYTKLDARMLDLMLILHAEHGGGNNSTFSVRVTSSSATDIYSSIAAGIGSLKGPKHGGANIKVNHMIEYLKQAVSDWTNDDEILLHLQNITAKKEFDKSGLIYGIGHAVYTLSDPRTVLLKKLAMELADEKGRTEEYEFLHRIETLAIEHIQREKHKTVCANVDFYSGFIYDLLGIPEDIFTPLFAMSRIVGWCAHRNEELNYACKRIIRPAYKCVNQEKQYVSMKNR